MSEPKIPWTDDFIDLPVEEIRRRVNSHAALVETLAFYADQNTYFGIGIFPERPCGALMDDFSETDDLGQKPGKRARESLAALAKWRG